MLFPSPTIHKDVVEEDQEIFPKSSPENVIHVRLKGCWGIGQPEGHDQELKILKVASEGSLLDVLLSDVDLVIT
jgi:hypothetical protein